MKKLVFILFYALFAIEGRAQILFPLDTVVYVKEKNLLREYCSINIFDNLLIETFEPIYRAKHGKNIFINKISVDSSNLFVDEPFSYGDNLLFETSTDIINKQKLIYYSLKDSKFHDYGYEFYSYDRDSFIIDRTSNFVYCKTNKKGIVLSITDINSKKNEVFADFTNLFEQTYYPEIGYIYECEIDKAIFFSNRKAIVTIGTEQTAEGFGGYRYFIVNKGKIIEKDVTSVFSNYKDEFVRLEVNFSFVDKNQKYLRASISFIAEVSFDNIYKDGLYNSNLEFVSELLLQEQRRTIGTCVKNGKLEYYFMLSFLNNETNVIIPYKFIPELDLAMYKVYHNGILTKEDIKGFGRYELGILRNLIFAKHNYDFNSVFYQAYFNLYAFYNSPEMRKSRTKDVSNKLTKEDKVNLKLIKSME